MGESKFRGKPVPVRPRFQPRTARGAATAGRLLEAAVQAFSQRGFHRASVAEICRLCRVANGTFYQYFASKEEIFLAVVADASQAVTARLRRALSPTSCPEERVLEAMRTYWDFVAEHAALHQVLREAEFVRLDVLRAFYRHLAKLYGDALADSEARAKYSGFDREAIAYALLGVQEFIALRYLLWSQDFSDGVVQTVREFLAHGLDGGAPYLPPVSAKLPPELLEAKLPQRTEGEKSGSGGERTRARILEAAEVEFGAHGFHEASIADIARRADVAHGTVYLYFPSKEALFAELVREINRQLRAHIRRRTQGLEDRREVEIAGFEAFFEFISKHPQAYRIVREAEFVGTGASKGEAGRGYYERLARGYVRGLKAGMAAGQIRPLNPEVLAWALMGVGHFLGLRWIVWEGTLPPAKARDTLRSFLLQGLP